MAIVKNVTSAMIIKVLSNFQLLLKSQVQIYLITKQVILMKQLSKATPEMCLERFNGDFDIIPLIEKYGYKETRPIGWLAVEKFIYTLTPDELTGLYKDTYEKSISNSD